MESIIFLETNKSGSSRDGIKAAKELGYKVHLLTAKRKIQQESDQYQEIDEIYILNLRDLQLVEDTIFKINSSNSVKCIVSFIDSYVYLAAKLSNQFCQTRLSAKAMEIMEDKILTRHHLKQKKYSLYYYILKQDKSVKEFLKDFRAKFPLVVKLPKSCGSKDVYFVKSVVQLQNRLNFLRNKYTDEEILIEEYLDGTQVIVESLVHEGRIQIASIIEQEITRSEKFIVTGYSISNEIETNKLKALIEVSHEIINDLGLMNGNCHLELRYDGKAWKLIEVNPRIAGGVVNDLIQEAYGYNYAKQIIQVYSGNIPLINKSKEETIYAHYMTVHTLGKLQKVTGKSNALKIPGVIDVFIKPKKGRMLMPPLSMGNRYGYVLAKGKTKEEAKKVALIAADKIKFFIEPL
ncbi:ATP-grasp domain-containing protein [Ureibacillus chungkukjangi]|uniref:ATP-grasp domain-containing protein n=1 Tax=Ureibacillus chungkukjangi TaxID=1202712 RepID=UPI00203CDF7C|nr:ATP-grasp domain-containing protein [Ureibacillus chungkukjangi]MCM3390586.1 ATP-grasp domain-containing protein [Ureibacillus chungkukjangi]